MGDSGLKRWSGFISEEFLAELQGQNGIRLYAEMSDNHPIVGGILHAINTLIRSVKWRVEAATQTPEDIQSADFISSCLDDMSVSWQDTVSEFLSFLPYGYSYHEICYKMRGGPENPNDLARSRYNDQRVGWDGFQIRSQDSLYKWEFDDNGKLCGMWQSLMMVTSRSKRKPMHVFIPLEKALHFKTRSHKGNPEGRSILRNAVVPFLRQRKMEEIEAIGMERDLAGYPVGYAPLEYFGSNATPAQKQFLYNLKSTVMNMRRDKSEGVVLPSDCYKDGGAQQVRIELLSAAGSRQFDTTAILGRLDQRIAMSVLADFMMLGHQGVGSYALAENKTELFAVAIGSYLDIICEEFNRSAIPRLCRLNGFGTAQTPRLAHEDIDQRDLTVLANYVTSLSAAGMPLFPDPSLEGFLRSQAGMPDPSSEQLSEVGTGQGTITGSSNGGGYDPSQQG